ncbi:MAG: cytochrome P460 family protein [Myxococcota bacterium]
MNRRAALCLAAAASTGCVDAAAISEDVPRDPEPLQRWLAAGEYEDWESESAVFVNDNGIAARIFVDPSLAQSLEEGRRQHPVGATAVREIYEPDQTTLMGWAAVVKLRDDDGGAGEWLWFEVFETDPDADPLVAESAAPGCVTCHDAAADAVQSAFPLR